MNERQSIPATREQLISQMGSAYKEVLGSALQLQAAYPKLITPPHPFPDGGWEFEGRLLEKGRSSVLYVQYEEGRNWRIDRTDTTIRQVPDKGNGKTGPAIFAVSEEISLDHAGTFSRTLGWYGAQQPGEQIPHRMLVNHDEEALEEYPIEYMSYFVNLENPAEPLVSTQRSVYLKGMRIPWQERSGIKVTSLQIECIYTAMGVLKDVYCDVTAQVAQRGSAPLVAWRRNVFAISPQDREKQAHGLKASKTAQSDNRYASSMVCTAPTRIAVCPTHVEGKFDWIYDVRKPPLQIAFMEPRTADVSKWIKATSNRGGYEPYLLPQIPTATPK